jgi:hypothetical protein
MGPAPELSHKNTQDTAVFTENNWAPTSYGRPWLFWERLTIGLLIAQQIINNMERKGYVTKEDILVSHALGLSMVMLEMVDNQTFVMGF